MPHHHLLTNLQAAGIDGKVANWIKALLIDRKQRVCVRGVSSWWRDVRSDVPQGTVMGPTLFLVYIIDLFDGLNSEGKLFTDDAKIYRRIKDITDNEHLQEDLNKLQEWSMKWLLNFNS